MFRLGIEILPSVALLTHNNCSTKFIVHNNSSETKTIKKGSVIARSCDEFRLLEDSADSDVHVNSIDERKHVNKIIDEKLGHLNSEQFKKAKTLLNKYKDIFSVSNCIFQRFYIILTSLILGKF